MERETYSIH